MWLICNEVWKKLFKPSDLMINSYYWSIGCLRWWTWNNCLLLDLPRNKKQTKEYAVSNDQSTRVPTRNSLILYKGYFWFTQLDNVYVSRFFPCSLMWFYHLIKLSSNPRLPLKRILWKPIFFLSWHEFGWLKVFKYFN